MGKHTPGPWTLGTFPDGRPCGCLVANGEPLNYDNCGQGAHTGGLTIRGSRAEMEEERQANARLIAAAPDLLAALRDLLAAHGDAGHGMSRDEYGEGELRTQRACLKCARALATIAKVEGKDE